MSHSRLHSVAAVVGVIALTAVIAAQPAKPNVPPAPADVAAPPADAQKTSSGLSTKVIQNGTGKVKDDDRNGGRSLHGLDHRR